MRRILPTACLFIAAGAAAGAQTCPGGICAGTIAPDARLPRAVAGDLPGASLGPLGRSAYDFRTDALGLTRDPAGNILPKDALGQTRTRDGRICIADANGMLNCR